MKSWPTQTQEAIRRALEPDILEPYGAPFVVTSRYGWRVHPIRGGLVFHHGVDFRLPVGMPVYAVLPGQVRRLDVEGIGKGKYNGNAVQIISRGGWSISYLHLFAPLVFVGDEVDRGGLVGLSGASGPVTGPHLHLAIFLDGRSIDPAVLFPAGSLIFL